MDGTDHEVVELTKVTLWLEGTILCLRVRGWVCVCAQMSYFLVWTNVCSNAILQRHFGLVRTF